MLVTQKQTRLACIDDTYVKRVLAHGEGDEALPLSPADHIWIFNPLMGMSTGEEMNMNALW